MNRFDLKCPLCGGENNADDGGSERCFHCKDCGFLECYWDDKEELINYVTKNEMKYVGNISEFYERIGR